MRLARRWKVALAVVGLTAAGAAVGFGPLVRSRAARVAERFGAQLEISTVRPVWDGVRLRDVVVRLEDAPSVSVRLEEVNVRGVLFGGRSVEVRGGDLEATGQVADLVAELAALRSRLGSRPPGAEGGSGTRLAVSGLRGKWAAVSGGAERVAVSGVTLELGEPGSPRVVADSVQGAFRGIEGTANGVTIAVRREGDSTRLAQLTAREAFVDASAPGDAARPPSAEPSSPSSPDERSTGSRFEGLRRRLDAAGVHLDGALTSDAQVAVDALSAKVRVNDQVFSIGPGRFELRREGERPRRLIVEVARAADEGEGKRLALKLSAAYGEGAAAAPFVLETHGGTIPVAALGLREGDLGLVEPERAWIEADATITLDDAAGTVRFEGDGRARALSLRHAAVAEQPIRGLDVAFRGVVAAKLDATRIDVTRGELEIGALHATMSGELLRRPHPDKRPTDWAVDLRWEVPLVACQSLLDAAPAGLLPLVSGSTMAGSLALKGTARFDTAQLDKTYDVRWDASVGCRMVAPRPQVAVERFSKAFKKSIYTPEGSVREAEFGPGTPDWTPAARITHLMEIAVVTAEDGRFARHGGFDHEAIRNSIRENIRARKFVRGASTISMQLAKNLYLPRDKTLSRKLEEAILTLYLEQVLTKEQMIELYLNVVEFGPMIYGIGPAAQHYFRTSPAALTVSQSFYLASILPSPRKQHFAAGGAVTGAWMSHLRRLMKYANHRGRLGDAELDEGLTEVPVFGSSAPIREALPVLPGDESDDVPRRQPWEDGEGDG